MMNRSYLLLKINVLWKNKITSYNTPVSDITMLIIGCYEIIYGV